ncbi:hypothetical protein [Archangium sp.]|uniref:hypothetical protein n=1 Tax=Archangium sp. TaxID=1872627 RepID=UPI00286D6454|nr:hypothetical protein [Archangium sp.]
MKEPVNPFAVTQDDGATLVNQLGFALVLLPSIAALHYIGGPEASWVLACALCALSGALGGFLFGLGRAPAHAGILGGALASLCGMLLTCLCLARRERYLIIEAAFLWLLGCVPGVLTYKAVVEGSTPSRNPRD